MIEMIDHGGASTPFMRFGERVRMQALFNDGSLGPFGSIDQQLVLVANESTR